MKKRTPPVRTFWAKSEMFPPILVRILARRKNGPVLSDREIAGRCSLTAHQVSLISQGVDWRGVDLPTMREFLRGCGVDFCDRARMASLLKYIRAGGTTLKDGDYAPSGPKWSYLKRSPDWESVWLPMLARLHQALASRR